MFKYKVVKKTDPTVIIAEGTMKDGFSLPGMCCSACVCRHCSCSPKFTWPTSSPLPSIIIGTETAKVVVPANCTYSAMGAVGNSLMHRGKTDFIMKGETTYVMPMKSHATCTFPFVVEGQFAITGRPDNN